MNAKQTIATIDQVRPLTDSILQLRVVPDDYVEFSAGQYLHILLAEEVEPLCFSIANAPLGARSYELHIRHNSSNSSANRLLAEIKNTGKLAIKLPFGNCNIESLAADKPIIFIAGGTGFAQAKAMIEQLLADSDPRKFVLFWGARTQSDLYMDDIVIRWQEHVAHFNYHAVVSENDKKNLADLVIEQQKNILKESQIVLSGPFPMVHNLCARMVDLGVAKEQFFSDAFSF